MPTRSTTRVIEHIRSAVLRDGAEVGDGELLDRFIERRDEAALAVLVTRHGPMVWGVCRRLLGHHNAEDAFQATFLVLVRKAASVVPKEMVANWLYGVAHQTALQARRAAARRSAREVQVAEMPDTQAAQPNPWSDVQPLLDQELSHLPDMYRAVIVLCDLEGRTRKEVAGQLRVPEGTVAGRLARARALLAKRLARRGVALSGGALAMVLSRNVVAGMPNSVVSQTIRAANLLAAGPTTAVGVISPTAAALTEGALKAMRMSKLKAVVAVVLVLGALTAGATVLTSHTAAAQGDVPPGAEERVNVPPQQESAKEKDAFTSWGKEINGLQAGLGFRAGEKRVYTHGETVALIIRVRNVGKEEVQFQYLRPFFAETPPAVTGADGKPVPLDGLTARLGQHGPVDVSLAPGKEIELYEKKLELKPGNKVGSHTLRASGKLGLQYERVFGNSSSGTIKIDPALSKLTTGKLELEVKEAENAPVKEKEVFTSWGKEINGLQAGLGYHPGLKRAYTPGETVRIVLRVRNVGTAPVEFKHIWAFFVENPPTVTDAGGKLVQRPGLAAEGKHLPRTTTVAPGKDVELYEWEFELRPQGEGGKKEWSTIRGVGKFSLQCERVVGPTLSITNDPNPALGKLATGKLELEVKEAKKLPEQPDQEKPGVTAWGKEVDGVQAGLGYLPGAKRAYAPGETVKLVVRVRNVGKKNATFVYARESFYAQPPVVTNDTGKPVPFTGVEFSGEILFKEVTLAPGKEVDLCELNVALWPVSEKDKARPWSLYEAGKFQLQFERVGGNIGTGEIKIDPILSKLVTGKLELEIKADPAATEKK